MKLQVALTCLLGHLICINYFLLRSVKDALVVTANSGASIIPVLKLWALLPTLFVVGLISTKMVRRLGHKGLTVIALSLFSLYFPFANHFHLGIFYVVCELWKTTALSMIFWGFVNLKTSPREATWQYPLYLIGGSLSAFVASFWINTLLERPDWQMEVLLSVSVVSLLSLGVYLRLHRDVKEKVAMPKVTRGSFRAVMQSRVLPWLGLLIVAEYVSLQVVEILWKDAIYQTHTSAVAYAAYSSKIIFWTGVVGVVATVCAPLILRRFSWRTLALWTPFVGIALGLLFLFSPFTLLFGALHNCLFRASRQAIAGPVHQQAYLGLDNDQKIQGKAFICGLSPTIGKVIVALLFLGTPWASGVMVLAFVVSLLAIWKTQIGQKKIESVPY